MDVASPLQSGTPPAGGSTGPGVEPLVVIDQAPPGPTGFDLAAELFADDHLPEFDLELSPEALEDLRAHPTVWVEGAIVHAGVRFEPVAIRLKGQNSFLPIDEKPSLKVDLDRFVDGMDLLGLEHLTFDNMSGDPTMMHERVSYRLFREHGLPASRANHALLRINGEARGLYTLVEEVDPDLLELWYPDPGGALWELDGVDFVDADVAEFEHEAGPEDRAAIQAVADALELGGLAGYDAAAPWVDWAQLAEFVAATAVVGQFDSYPWATDDAHVYFDPADGRLDLVPHGMDETFHGVDHYVDHAAGLLFATCLASEACAADYVASIWDAQATSEAIDQLAYAQAVRAQIEPFARDDPVRPYTMEEIDAAQAWMLGFIENRAADLTSLLED